MTEPFGGRSRGSDVKLIAYYLPQFHPIPENDQWWGKGFTEWRNVVRAFPQFTDHYQPRVPGELGYYDLRVIDVMRRQAELAKLYSIDAFCFHFYWFAGKTLLELPLRNFLACTDIDMKFCLCWANENWSRRWDGSEEDVLIAQQHSPEDDLEFLRYLNSYFRDKRYLKVDGKPVLTVYRPSQLPNALATAQRWRQEILSMGYPGIYLVATNAFAFQDYQLIGFDALSEFPPHHVRAPNVQDRFELSRFREGWRIRLYSDVVRSEKSRGPVTGATVHPGVMPSWDNSARRPRNGEIIHGSSPNLFREWLDHAIEVAAHNPENEQFVFINAWNEWAEGAYLEPDRRYGYAYLEACRAAVSSHAERGDSHRMFAGQQPLRPNRPTVLLCAHWAARQIFGGERSFLDLARGLAAGGHNIVVALPESGGAVDVEADYIELLSKVAVEVRVFPYGQWTANRRKSLAGVSGFLRVIRETNPDIVYVNTIVVNAPIVASRLLGVPVVVHAREIIEHDPDLTSQIGLPPESIIRQVIRSADHIVANSSATARSFRDAQHLTVVPNVVDIEGLDLANEVDPNAVRFGLISSNFPKKGIADLVTLARLCLTEEPRARFVMIGPSHRALEALRHDGYETSLPPRARAASGRRAGPRAGAGRPVA